MSKTMRVLMKPHIKELGDLNNGIARVITHYFEQLPRYGIELVEPNATSFDLLASHAGNGPDEADVQINHGLYWTADYEAPAWEYATNAKIVRSLRYAKQVTVPSSWVAEVFQRDMRFTPNIIGHGIDWQKWQERRENLGYVLWNKNRKGDVCDPAPVAELAGRFPDIQFITTFADRQRQNIKEIGTQDHDAMRKLILEANVYLATTKETFGIGILEAMASGVPVLGFAHGGIVDLVRHGVSGYLARPGDYEDLSAGLSYCIKYRDRLGGNARALSTSWTWERAAEKMAGVFEKAMEEEPPTVAVIIPSYNYCEKVGRAIESVLSQTRKADRIIVVDDGSPDDGKTKKTVEKYKSRGVEYIRQDNHGVAIARNHGIHAAQDCKYIVCLDADDALEEEFISVCVDALETDRALGIAYTRLRWVNADGQSKLGGWPREWNYNEQVEGKNQIPTCCMFRRKIWERLGGYRQRYAPRGAGAEDAEFWLRAGAAGFTARLVDARGLFVYSLGTGLTTSDPNYKEENWLIWHPWTIDKKHPFASCARPRNISHPVMQYDEPMVSVIIPVGPGHEAHLLDALDSLEAQGYRKWEVIVINDTEKTDWMQYYTKSYPYIRWVDYPGCKGAGHARNRGAEIARAPFLFFLDADDWITPQCLEKHLLEWKREEKIVYSDYVGKTIIDDIGKLAPDLRQRIYKWDRETGEAVIGYRAAEYDCERALEQPDPDNIYMWCNVTVLIPKAWHEAIGGYDESMSTREDIDYHWRLARAGYCYTRIPEELFVYRFNTGHRREAGRQAAEYLLSYLKDKYSKDKPKMCGCRSKGPAPAMPASMAGFQQGAKAMDSNTASDADFVMVKYLSLNKGTHSVIGPATRRSYGNRAGGEMFLVHKSDAAAAPHLFSALEGDVGAISAPASVQAQILDEPPDLVTAKPKRRTKKSE